MIDSRKVEKDYLFVAIDGERVNAHKFIPDTVKAGAMCVVSHEDLGETDFPYILVESTGQALLDIAKLYRDSFDMKVVRKCWKDQHQRDDRIRSGSEISRTQNTWQLQ